MRRIVRFLRPKEIRRWEGRVYILNNKFRLYVNIDDLVSNKMRRDGCPCIQTNANISLGFVRFEDFVGEPYPVSFDVTKLVKGLESIIQCFL